MTVKEFNENFWPQYNKACSFVNCMEHALQKSDDNARMQMKVIGWDKDTQRFFCLMHSAEWKMLQEIAIGGASASGGRS